MGEGILTHIRLNGRPHDMACVGHVVAGHSVYNAQRKVYHANGYNGAHREG